MDDGSSVDIVHLGFAKAFNSVNKKALLADALSLETRAGYIRCQWLGQFYLSVLSVC